ADRPPLRRRPLVPADGRGARPAGGDAQGAGPPRPRAPPGGPRCRRARGDDRMIDTDDLLEAALHDLRTPAPAALTDRTLVELGLADHFATLESPFGPVLVA